MTPGIDNLPSLSPYSTFGSKFTQSFQQFVKDIADSKSKTEEDRIISLEVERLKIAILKPVNSEKQRKEQFVKLIYCDMLGKDVSFANMETVKNAQQQDLMYKRVSYTALGLFLNEENETERMMNMSSIQRDLQSSNVLNICFGLFAASKLVYSDMMQAVLPLLQNLLKDKRDVVRKKTLMVFYRFWKLNPDAFDFVSTFNQYLFDTDPSVMQSSLIAYYDLIQCDPFKYKKLTSTFVNILKQILDHRLPEEFNYKGYAAPWMQILLLKILALLGTDDLGESKKMYEILRQCLETTNTDQTIGCSVVYECLLTISTIYTDKSLMERATNKASVFITSEDYNMKYLGIKALSDFITTDFDYAAKHQQVIINCLQDHDDSLKRKTLELLYRMANVSNVVTICEEMIKYLRSTMDDYIRSTLVTQITTLADKFAPDNEWFIMTMNEVFELGGHLVQEDVAHNIMRLIGEGIDDVNSSGDDNDSDDVISEATRDLRDHALISYVTLMDKPCLPDLLVKLVSWVVGEYIEEDMGYDLKSIVEKMTNMIYRPYQCSETQAWIITGITKILARSSQPSSLFVDIDISKLGSEARRRYSELKSILKLCNPVMLSDVLPYDGSCEDIEPDETLGFLDGFVQQALLNGAQPYSSELSQASIRQEDTEQVHVKRTDLIYVYDAPTIPSKSAPVSSEKKSGEDSLEDVSQYQKHDQSAILHPSLTPQQGQVPITNLSSNKPGKWQKDRGLVTRSSESDMTSSVGSPTPSSRDGSSTHETRLDGGRSRNNSSSSSKTSEDKSSGTRSSGKPDKKEQLAKSLFGGGSQSTKTPSSKRPTSGRGGKRTSSSRSNKNRTDASLLGDFPSQGDNTPQLLGDNDVSQSNNENDLLSQSLGDNFAIGSALLSQPLGDMNSLISPTTSPTPPNDLLDGLSLSPMNITQPLSPQFNSNKDAGVVDLMGDMMNLEQSNSTQHTQESLLLPSSNLSPTNPQESTLLPPSSPPLKTLTPIESTQVPDHLKNVRSTTVKELASDMCLRISNQFVFQDDKLAVALHVTNKTVNPLKNLRIVITPPSCLRGTDSELNFQMTDTDLEPNSNFCHVINLTHQSPSPKMALNGQVSYKDFTNTEKKVFINLNIPWSAILRKLDLQMAAFEEGWRNKSLHDLKQNIRVSMTLERLMSLFEQWNINLIKEIAGEIIASSTVLKKETVLFHFNIKQHGSVEVRIKSSSERLNDCIYKFIHSEIS
eukprot:TCONS_00007391-protein